MSNNQNNTNNQNNNQQGSLLRRVNNTTNNQQNTNNPNNQNNNNQQNNNNNGLRSRLSNQNQNQQPVKPSWTITPIGRVGVKFSFQGIGDPLYRILGTPLDKSLTDIDGFVAKITDDESLMEQLMEMLDEAWLTYEFRGAAMMHPVRKNIEQAFMLATTPIIDTTQQNNDNDANNNNTPPPIATPNTPAPYGSCRAVDALFVLNILGRVRGTVLVEETPIALESGFLHQSYICDDPRIVDLALATGAIEEAW